MNNRKNGAPDMAESRLVHQLRMENELRSLQLQGLEAFRSEHGDLERRMDDLQRRAADAERLRQHAAALEEQRDSLRAQVELQEGQVSIWRSDHERMSEAEHHLSRLLTRIERSPLGWVARRKPGYRAMVERFVTSRTPV